MSENERAKSLTGYLKDHSVQAIAISPFIVAAFTVIIVSRGDPQVFSYLLQHLNVTALLIGVILPFVPVAVLWLLIAVLVNRYAKAKDDRRPINHVSQFIYVLIVTSILLALQTIYALTTIGMLLLFWIEARATRYHNDKAIRRYGDDAPVIRVRKPTFGFAVVYLAVVLVQMLVVNAPTYIPNERLALKGQQPITAQIIVSDFTWTIYLNGRAVQIAHTTEIESREPCYRDTSIAGRTLGNLIVSSRTKNISPYCPR